MIALNNRKLCLLIVRLWITIPILYMAVYISLHIMCLIGVSALSAVTFHLVTKIGAAFDEWFLDWCYSLELNVIGKRWGLN